MSEIDNLKKRVRTLEDEVFGPKGLTDVEKILQWAEWPDGFDFRPLSDVECWFGREELGGFFNVAAEHDELGPFGDFRAPSLHVLLERRGLEQMFAEELVYLCIGTKPPEGASWKKWYTVATAPPIQRARALLRVIEEM